MDEFGNFALLSLKKSVLFSYFSHTSSNCFRPYQDVAIPMLSSEEFSNLGKTKRLKSEQEFFRNVEQLDESTDSVLAFFRGRITFPEGGAPNYSRGIREKLHALYSKDKQIIFEDSRDENKKKSRQQYIELYNRSKFCISIRGFAPWSPRLIEVRFLHIQDSFPFCLK